jgi:apolipoprotein N-acyltransferase
MNQKKIGVLICYEAVLAQAARAYKRNGADVLVTISNDAWFGKTSAPFQHFSMMVLRAVETRLYLIRAANTGISGIVDPAGRVLKTTEIFKEDALKGEIRFIRMATFYSKHGDVLVWACFLMFLVFFLISFKKGGQT